MLGVEQWAEIRRMHLVEQVPIKEIVRRTGLARNTVRAALRSKAPPRYERQGRPSKLAGGPGFQRGQGAYASAEWCVSVSTPAP